MDGLSTIAHHLTSARLTLEESNAQAARTQRDRFETLVGEFIDCAGPFEAFGGVCNLLTMVAQKCEANSRRELDDWERVATFLDASAVLCDLQYRVAK